MSNVNWGPGLSAATHTALPLRGRGLVVVTDAMSHLQTASLGCWVTCGSRHEQADEHGISHFLEHMLFKGTERFKKGEIDLVTEIDLECERMCRAVLAERRRAAAGSAPPDLLSVLLAACDRERRISEAELIATAIFTLIAGYETMTNVVGVLIMVAAIIALLVYRAANGRTAALASVITGYEAL